MTREWSKQSSNFSKCVKLKNFSGIMSLGGTSRLMTTEQFSSSASRQVEALVFWRFAVFWVGVTCRVSLLSFFASRSSSMRWAISVETDVLLGGGGGGVATCGRELDAFLLFLGLVFLAERRCRVQPHISRTNRFEHWNGLTGHSPSRRTEGGDNRMNMNVNNEKVLILTTQRHTLDPSPKPFVVSPGDHKIWAGGGLRLPCCSNPGID